MSYAVANSTVQWTPKHALRRKFFGRPMNGMETVRQILARHPNGGKPASA
jgi:hypothetical protein